MKEEKTQIKMALLGLLTIVAAVLASSGAFAAQNTAMTTINANIGSTITLNNSGTVSISVLPSAGVAKMSSNVDNLNVITNNTAGYNLKIEMQGANTNLLSGSNTIAATSGSFEAPAALDDNSWGFRVDGAGGFGAGPTLAETNQASSAHTWAAVPANGAAKTIKTTSVATSSSGDATKVWYAIKVDASKPSGEYRGTVSYTATTR